VQMPLEIELISVPSGSRHCLEKSRRDRLRADLDLGGGDYAMGMHPYLREKGQGDALLCQRMYSEEKGTRLI
jgi:hypothetical protein